MTVTAPAVVDATVWSMFTTTPDYFVGVFLMQLILFLPSYKYLFDIPTLQKNGKKNFYFKNKNFYFKMRAKILSENFFLSKKLIFALNLKIFQYNKFFFFFVIL